MKIKTNPGQVVRANMAGVMHPDIPLSLIIKAGARPQDLQAWDLVLEGLSAPTGAGWAKNLPHNTPQLLPIPQATA